jgi:hypothetical protein
MKTLRNAILLMAAVFLNTCLVSFAAKDAEPLPSWNDGPAKQAILEFVAAVTDENGKDYVKPAERIATFDNDGTLWVEYPMGVGGMVATGHSVKSLEERKLSTTFLPLKLPLSGLLQFRTKAISVIYN